MRVFDCLAMRVAMLMLSSLCASAAWSDCVYDAERIKTEIMAVYARATRGWNEGNIEKYMGMFEKTDSLRTVMGDRAYFGWQKSIDDFYESDPDGSQMGRARTLETDILVLAPDSAVLYERFAITLGEEITTGATTAVFRLRDEGWRIVHSHISYGS